MNRKIIGYKIVSSSDSSRLEDYVSIHISDGWEPIGNLMFTPPYEDHRNMRSVKEEYLQPMVKYKEEE